MAERFTVDVRMTPAPQVVASAFFALKERIENLWEPMLDAVEIVATDLEESFAVEGRPPWEPLAESTIEKKGHDTILEDSGEMSARATDPAAWKFAKERSGLSATLDTDALPDYWHFHITGTRFMPVRDFLTITEQAANEVEQVFAEYVQESANATLRFS